MGKLKWPKRRELENNERPENAKASPSNAKGGAASPQRNGDQVNASLAAIYGAPSAAASRPLMKTFIRGERSTWKLVVGALAAVIVVLTLVAWAGYWWWGTRGFSGGGLSMVVEGPTRISIGQETAFFINWFNRSGEPLAASEFRVSFPSDFVVSSVEPKPTSEPLIFRLGSQAAEARGTIKISGTFTGALGTKSAIQVIGTYRPASFNSDFEELATKELDYADTVLEGSLDIPPKVLPGDRVQLVYHLLNKGQDPLKGLEARIHLPEGFVRDSSNTSDVLDGRVVALSVGTLEAAASSTVRVNGSFALGSHGEVQVVAEAGRVKSDGTFAAAERTESTISVLAGDLQVAMVVNGSDKDRSVSLGERQRVAISYENTSGEELHDVVLRVHFGSETPLNPLPKATSTIDLVDWHQLDDSNGGVRDHDVLTYGVDQIGELERLPVDANGLIEFSVPLTEWVTSTRDGSIVAYVEATIGAVDKVKVNRTVKTQLIHLRVQTDAALESIARYASEEGAQLGHGPLPPTVGTTTTYRVEWTVTKTLHALDHLTVSANLPKNVAWGGTKEVGAGEMKYDEALRLVSWTINKMPQDINELTASFDVALTPFESDAGRFASLLGETRFEFTDATLSEPLLRTSPSLSTDLQTDDLAKGKGVVKKP